MSTDEDFDSAAEGRRPSAEHDARAAREGAADASDAAAQAILDVERQPLDERAPSYQALADRLRVELEQSDPHAAR